MSLGRQKCPVAVAKETRAAVAVLTSNSAKAGQHYVLQSDPCESPLARQTLCTGIRTKLS